MDEEKLTASQKDYLEAIYHITDEKMAARAKDIARRLKVKASSVTGALRTLGAMELINYAPYDLITLTDEGRAVAENIVRRHEALKRFLVDVLGIERQEAEEAVCSMEHWVPEPIVDRLVKYSEYVAKCPKGGVRWTADSGYFCREECVEDKCRRTSLKKKKN